MLLMHKESAARHRYKSCVSLTAAAAGLNAANYFDNDEFILADAAFTCCSNIIPMYKRPRGHPRLSGHLAFFNRQAAQARYRIEHAIRYLEGSMGQPSQSPHLPH